MDEQRDDGRDSGGHGDVRSTMMRSVKMTLLIFGLLIVGLTITSLVTEDAPDIPFVYDGFD